MNDYFLNQMYNVDFSPGDFATVGLNSSNTIIQDKDVYKSLDLVKSNPMFQTDGEFDDKKFDQFYNKAMFGFKQMSETGSNERLASSYASFRDDIFSSNSHKKNQGAETFITKIANPNKQTLGFVNSNIMEAPTQSVREIAQAQMVWNGEKWIESPNETPLMNFFNPKVLAQWDFDADENGNPTNDKDKIVYHKGEKKINPLTGTYYYETLNGRSIYGREVLSGWDTLTVDGSAINKYDFFDSDDIDKSFRGSLMKSIVKVVPALIPAISPWYIGARMALSMSDLSGKIMKMTTGSDNSVASWLEGVNAAFTESTSDWARGSQEYGIEGHPWSLENLMNLGADVFTQLAEQRWVFKYGSALTSGKLGYSKEAQKAFKNEKMQEWMSKIGQEGKLTGDNTTMDMLMASSLEAQSMLENKIKSSQKLGEYLSKLYMTGIVAADSYSEAKEAGLNDVEASLFTLVYALGEYGILNTGLGEHILPELRAERRRTENMFKALAQAPERQTKDTRKWYKKIMDTAKNAVSRDSNDAIVAASLKAKKNTLATAQIIGVNALGEGLEEVSEEFWLDLAKSLYNGASKLGLTATNQTMEAFDDGDLAKLASRYALNFTGGVIGGGVAVGLPGFTGGIKDMLGTDMSRKQAYQELVALVRNGKKEELFKTIDKLEIADSNLAASHEGQGTDNDNLNKANKDLLKGMVNMVDDLLNTNGVSIDDSSILKHLSEPARGLAKFQALLGNDEREGSTILASYVQRFNTLSTEIVDTNAKIKALEEKNGDKAPNLTSDEQTDLGNLKVKLARLQKMRDNYLNGEMAKNILPKVLFELAPSISTPYIATNFRDYVEKVEHRVLTEIPEDRLKQLKQEWEDYKSGGAYADDFQQVFGFFKLINEKFSDKLGQFDLQYFRNPKDYQQLLGNVFMTSEDQLFQQETPEDIQGEATSFFKQDEIADNPTVQRNISALAQLIQFLPNDVYKQEIAILRMIPKTLEKLKERVGEEQFNNAYIPYLQEAAKDFNINGGIFDPNAENADATMVKIRDRALRELAVDVLTNPKNSDNIKQVLNSIPYMNQTVKDFLISNGGFFAEFMNKTGDNQNLLEVFDDDDFDPEYQRIVNLQREYKDIIKNKQNSPIDELADQFQLAIGDNSMPISEILKTLDAQAKQLANKRKIETFGYEDNIQKQINHALQVVQLLSSHILASRKDGAKLGNLFGYNSTLNQLNPDTKLIEIDKEVADTLMQDLAKLNQRLLTFANLFNINSGQKLVEQKKIKSRIDFNFIKKTKDLIGILPDDWIGKEELNSAINNATVFIDLSNQTEEARYNIDQDKRKILQKESILVQDAIYDFFNKNKDKDFQSLFDKLVLLPSSTEESKSANGTIIDNNLNDFDDRTFVGMLASAAAVRASDFYTLFKDSIDPKYAPIPGQELATRMAFSFLMNQPLFEKFGKSYNDKILKELSGVNAEFYREHYGKYVSPESKLDNSYALQFMHTFLVEGIPGAGKSTGFYKVLLNMLNKFKPELLKKVWIVHTDADKALNLGKELGLKEENIVAHSKKSYLESIYPDYTEPKVKNGVIQQDKNDLVEDTESGISSFKNVEIKQDLDAPSLIIFDESTRFSQQEFLVSEKFQREYGINGIATGDYDQIGAVGQVQLDENTKLVLNTFQDNFFHSPKLGTSMRTENKIKDKNITSLRSQKSEIIKQLRAGSNVSKVNLEFYQDNTGLYGEKIVSSDDNLDEIIGLMLDTLKDEEKVVLISDNPDSDLYKRLQNINEKDEKYKGKIEFQSSGAAQGSESQYYIVDLNPMDIGEVTKENDGNHEIFVNTFYTAISRSKQGTLIIKNRNIEQIATNKVVSELVKSPLSADSIRQYGTEFIDSLSDITGDINNINYVDIRNKSRKAPVKRTTVEENPEGDIAPTDKDAAKMNHRKYPITNGDPKVFNILTHSMPVSETGFTKDARGNYIVSDPVAYPQRIDGLNGITKLPSMTIEKDGKSEPITSIPKTLGLKSDRTLNNQTEALNRLNAITQAGLYFDDKEMIKKIIITELGLNLSPDEIGIDFLFEITNTNEDYVEQRDENSKKDKKWYNRLFKSLKEKLIGVHRGPRTTSDIEDASQNKYFSLNVHRIVDGKKVNFLTVPLAIFTSPLTMLNTEDFAALNSVFKKQAGKNMEVMKDLLKNDPAVKSLPNADKLLKALEIYTYKNSDGDVVVYMPDDWTLAGASKAITGPTITVSKLKGYDYVFTDKFQYNGEYVELKDIDQSVHHLSKDIYYTPEDVLNAKGEVVIRKGHRFVLVSDYHNYNNDSDMFADFERTELKGKSQGIVSVIYVSAPKVSIQDFFRNFALKYKGATRGEDKIDTNIGNEFSEFRIAEFITKNDSAFDQYMKELTKDTSDKISMLARWEVFKNIVTSITSDMEKMTPEEKVNLFKKSTKFADSKYINLITTDGSDSVKRIINALRENYAKGDQSIKNFISNQLLYFVIKNNKGLADEIKWTFDGKLDISENVESNINKVIESLDDSWKEGVFTQLESRGEGNELNIGENTYIPIKSTNYMSDTESIKEGNRAIRINGKLDTTMHVIDANPIMDHILATINDNSKKGMQRDWYIADSRKASTTIPKDPVLEELKSKGYTGMSIELIMKTHPDEFKDKNVTQENVLLEVLNKIGYGILFTDSETKIVALPPGITQKWPSNIFKKDGQFYLITTDGHQKLVATDLSTELKRFGATFVKNFDTLELNDRLMPEQMFYQEAVDYVKSQEEGDKLYESLNEILNSINFESSEESQAFLEAIIPYLDENLQVEEFSDFIDLIQGMIEFPTDEDYEITNIFKTIPEEGIMKTLYDSLNKLREDAKKNIDPLTGKSYIDNSCPSGAPF